MSGKAVVRPVPGAMSPYVEALVLASDALAAVLPSRAAPAGLVTAYQTIQETLSELADLSQTEPK